MKINLASGQRPFGEGWTNIDIKDQGYPVDILTDAKDLSMIPDESVDIIVAHHLVEHLPLHHLEMYITEWRRVLRKGGILSVFVPDLREITKGWLEGRINTYIHNVNTYGAYQDSIHDLHKWGYDQQELDDRMRGWDGSNFKFEWEIRDLNPTIYRSMPIFEGSDCCFDWWILARMYVKN